MRLDRRLASAQEELKKKGIGRPPPVLRGALEMHCPGGLGHIEGLVCDEHEACVYTSSPIMGSIIRQYIFDWHEGMTEHNLEIG